MTSPREFIRDAQRRVASFEAVAHSLLEPFETSTTSRVATLTQAWRDVDGLSVLQDSLLRDALHCIENGLYKAAHVMAWAAMMDLVEEKLDEDGLSALRGVRPKWKAGSREELRENVVEFQLLEAARDLGLLSKTQSKSLHGMLSKRNECAHPGGYDPGLNEALGYVSEVLQRMRALLSKSVIAK